MAHYTSDQLSPYDKEGYLRIRQNVNDFLSVQAKVFDHRGIIVLDIAPQIHEGAKKYFKLAKVKTLDIDPSSDCDYIADITKKNGNTIAPETFDVIVCTEVLEHTYNPFAASSEMWRILKHDGSILLSVPFNFRIHGPLPDCWRITEYGLRSVFSQFRSIDIAKLETEDRPLMPTHYTAVITK